MYGFVSGSDIVRCMNPGGPTSEVPLGELGAELDPNVRATSVDLTRADFNPTARVETRRLWLGDAVGLESSSSLLRGPVE